MVHKYVLPFCGLPFHFVSCLLSSAEVLKFFYVALLLVFASIAHAFWVTLKNQ
jgi:hypothetical protein